MTALKEYDRIEATGLWRANADAQRREVIVSIGDATLTISDHNDRALAHWSLPAIERANQRRAEAGEAAPIVRAIVDPINRTGSTRFVGFPTTKPVISTDMGLGAPKCQVNNIVLDSGWEKTMGMALQKHSKVISYVKNQGVGFTIPYKKGTASHAYIPDFLVRIDVGTIEPLNLIVEVKGKRDDDAAIKADTAQTLWVPSVNSDGRFGHWAYHEFTDVWMMETELEAKVSEMIDSLESN